jgi:hypothetical protein
LINYFPSILIILLSASATSINESEESFLGSYLLKSLLLNLASNEGKYEESVSYPTGEVIALPSTSIKSNMSHSSSSTVTSDIDGKAGDDKKGSKPKWLTIGKK